MPISNRNQNTLWGVKTIEFLNIVIPFFLMITFNSHSMKWAYGIINLGGAIGVITILAVMSYYSSLHKMWIFISIGMLFWSLWGFINSILSDKIGSLIVFELINLKEALPYFIDITFFFSGLILIFSLCVKTKPLNYIFITNLINLVFMVVTTSWLLNNVITDKGCVGIIYEIFAFPCIIQSNLTVVGYAFFSLLLLITPIFIVAIFSTEQNQLLNLLTASSFLPIWNEILFFPSQIFGKTLLDIIRNDYSLISQNISYPLIEANKTIVIILWIMIFPLGLWLIKPANLQYKWSVFILVLSVSTNIGIISLGLFARPIFPATYIDLFLFVLLLLQIHYPIFILILMIKNSTRIAYNSLTMKTA